MSFKHLIREYLFGSDRPFSAPPDNQKDFQKDLTLLRNGVGRIEEKLLSNYESWDIKGSEFQVYSQWGEDGIIQFLLRHVEIPDRRFIEFGVESYSEANTRWLVEAHDWSGLVIDGSRTHIDVVKRDPIYWKHRLVAVQAFITRENINQIIHDNGLIGEIGILSIDIDGMDYWVWEQINLVHPAIVIVEYNSLFGPKRSVTAPYNPEFVRQNAHHSLSYYGASLNALVRLGRRKGFSFVGSNSAGNNAFFVRTDLLKAPLRELTAEEGYVKRSFREARDEKGNLIFPTFEEECMLIANLPLVEVQ